MDQKTFLEKTGKLFDGDAHFTSSFSATQRTFTEAERTTFLQHMWELFVEEGVEVDFESAVFVLALQGVQRKYQSVQRQAAHLQETIIQIRESLKAKTLTVLKVP